MEITKREIDLISEIANRGLGLINKRGAGDWKRLKKLDLMMDIEYAHEETPMDLEKFLAFDEGDFGHDIFGIVATFNRTSLKMDNCFSPRCTLHVEDRVNSKLQGLSLAVANERFAGGIQI